MRSGGIGTGSHNASNRCGASTCYMAGNNWGETENCKKAREEGKICPGTVILQTYRDSHKEAGCKEGGRCVLGGMFYLGKEQTNICVVTSGG